MEITGRVFEVIVVNNYVAKLVIQKKVGGKQTPIALEALGYHRDQLLKLKLKKGDKVSGTLELKSRLYKGKYYTDVNIKNVQLLQAKEPKATPTDPNQSEISFLPNQQIIDPETGEILL